MNISTLAKEVAKEINNHNSITVIFHTKKNKERAFYYYKNNPFLSEKKTTTIKSRYRRIINEWSSELSNDRIEKISITCY